MIKITKREKKAKEEKIEWEFEKQKGRPTKGIAFTIPFTGFKRITYKQWLKGKTN